MQEEMEGRRELYVPRNRDSLPSSAPGNGRYASFATLTGGDTAVYHSKKRDRSGG